ncbi:MAG: hypothetical protein ACOYVG_06810 [Bacteroidota bacterium]
MKKAILFFITVLMVSLVSAQEPQRKMMGQHRNIEVLKVAYFTKQLSLTTEEAEKFWPLYNGYTSEVRKARADHKEDILAFEESVLNIRKKFRGDIKKVLVTDERVNKALVAEREFMNVVRKELQHRMEQRRKMRDTNKTDQ